jgi:hypothetical protein
MNGFNYENVEVVSQKGGKIVRKVSIKKGRGHKSITKYNKGKRISTVKKPIHKHHIEMIKNGKFIPGLFSDCKGCKTKKRRGGNDEEMGPPIKSVEPYDIPPDPKRFEDLEKKMLKSNLSRPSSPQEVESVFSGPTPEGKEVIERNTMAWEDPLNQDPFDREQLQIFKGGKTRKRRYRKK